MNKLKALHKKTMHLISRIFRNKNIAMFHIGRCGSTVVGNMLNSHPDIAWGGELFEEIMAVDRRLENASDVKNIISNNCYSNIKKYYGFETKYMPQTHLSADCINMSLKSYIDLLCELTFTKFIVLHRRNYLRRAVSGEVGRKRGEWHSEKDVKNPTRVRLDIHAFKYGQSTHELIDLFRLFDNNYKSLKDCISEQNALDLFYEDDILNDPTEAYMKICSYLEVKPSSPKVSLKKTNPFSCEEMIENFDEIQPLLESTEYAWMLCDN